MQPDELSIPGNFPEQHVFGSLICQLQLLQHVCFRHDKEAVFRPVSINVAATQHADNVRRLASTFGVLDGQRKRLQLHAAQRAIAASRKWCCWGANRLRLRTSQAEIDNIEDRFVGTPHLLHFGQQLLQIRIHLRLLPLVHSQTIFPVKPCQFAIRPAEIIQ